MLIKTAKFVTSAVKPSQYPPAVLPEIAFAGRSNVGKSSLINTLVNRKRLVKTSSTPGRTQLINFFELNTALSLVDLPGYGYARVPVAIRRQWGPMVETYLRGRPTLKGVVVIVDARRTPGIEDLNLVDWLQALGVGTILAVTKTDKLSNNQLARQRKAIAAALALDPGRLILFSAKTRRGRDDVWAAIEELIDVRS